MLKDLTKVIKKTAPKEAVALSFIFFAVAQDAA